MTYEPRTDFLAILRDRGTSNRVGSMPGLDFVVAALARAGLIAISAAPTPPAAGQGTTLWLKTGSPDYASESDVLLWDTSLPTPAYASATPALFAALIFSAAGASGSGALSTVLDGFGDTIGGALVRGINGWTEANPSAPAQILVSGTPNQPAAWTALSAMLDAAAGDTPGMILYRAADAWHALAPGADGTVLQGGAAVAWGGLTAAEASAALDELGSTQGNIVFRGAAGWQALPAGADGLILTAAGDGADVAWTNANNPSGIMSIGKGVTVNSGVLASVVGNDTASASNAAAPLSIPSQGAQFTINNFGALISSASITTTTDRFTVSEAGMYLLITTSTIGCASSASGSGSVWNAELDVIINGTLRNVSVDNSFSAGASSGALVSSSTPLFLLSLNAGDFVQIGVGMNGTAAMSTISASISAALMRIN